MSFLPISIIAYFFNAGALLVDKILIRTTLPNPTTYTFYVNILQLLVILLIPFGFHPTLGPATYLAIASGLVGVLAFFAYFTSLKHNEASVVGPVVGTFNPLFSLLIGGWFLNQALAKHQYVAFFVLIIGTIFLTWNFWKKGLQLNRKFLWMIAAGFLFGVSYVLLREAFLASSFLDGFIISRTTSGIFVASFLLFPHIRKHIISYDQKGAPINNRGTLLLFLAGQIMGALSVTLITFGVSLASPALVNALFGIQYLVILAATLILANKHPHLLDEKLSQKVITRKIFGAGIISLGLYLLAK